MTMGAPSDRKCSQRNRIKYTSAQLERLEREFGISHYPDTATMEDLAMTLNVSLDRVSIWFQNRRSKFKRQSKDSQVTWMRKQIFHQDATSASGSIVPPKFVPQRHVLSAPTYPPSRRRDMAWSRPSSNLHYLPSVPSIFDQLPDLPHTQTASSNGSQFPFPPETVFYTSYYPTPALSPPESPTVPSPMTSPLSPRTLMMTQLLSEGHQMIPSTTSHQTSANQAPSSCVFANNYSPGPFYPACSTPFSSRPQMSEV
ncbi:paired box protein Pax-6-like [Argopecten irradians]|uniref:paired box protein Pax-6-like n=1 Tax=Argopecten irradians TaxID=31199 RepID=UPI0037111C50